MTALASRRALRVGVLLGERLVEERVLAVGSPVTFGQALRCTLSVPGDGVPLAHTLFVVEGGRLMLRVPEGAGGRITCGHDVRADVRGTIVVERGTRGRLQIGEVTVLFQEIAAPPVAPRPVLPASVRGTLADRVDRRLAVIVGASLLAHLGIAGYAWLTDAETPSMFSPRIAQTYRQEVMEVELPDEPVVAPAPAVAAPVAPAVQTPTPTRPTARPRITSRPMTRDTDAAAARFASILSGADEGPAGVGHAMGERKPGADLAAQIADASMRQLRIGDDASTFRDQPGPRLGTDARPLVDDPAQAPSAQPKPPERDPGRVVVRPAPGQPRPGTTLTVAMVLDKINTVYMNGLVRCYRKGLAGDAQLGGKIAVAFTVTERGTLEDISARGVSAEVDACVAGQMGGWRYPVPRDQDGDPDTEAFALVLALQPS
jgi:hypothetical protein